MCVWLLHTEWYILKLRCKFKLFWRNSLMKQKEGTGWLLGAEEWIQQRKQTDEEMGPTLWCGEGFGWAGRCFAELTACIAATRMKEGRVWSHSELIKATLKAFQSVQSELLRSCCCDWLQGGFVSGSRWPKASRPQTQQAHCRDGDVLSLMLYISVTGLPGELCLCPCLGFLLSLIGTESFAFEAGRQSRLPLG